MRKNTLLWVVQGVLALLFLFAGGMKLVLSIEAMTDAVLTAYRDALARPHG